MPEVSMREGYIPNHKAQENPLEPITVSNLTDVVSCLSEIERRLQAHGWALLNAYGSDETERREALLEIGSRLGRKQFHPRSDQDGIALIATVSAATLSLHRGT